MTAVPHRLRLSRRKGFDLQAASRALNGLPAVSCARPHRWSNHWKIGSNMWDPGISRFRTCETIADCVQAFARCVDWDPSAKQTLVTPWEDGTTSVLDIWGGYGPEHRNRKTAAAELACKNLACWCRLCAAHAHGRPLGAICSECAPCHVDPLLALANPRAAAA